MISEYVYLTSHAYNGYDVVDECDYVQEFSPEDYKDTILSHLVEKDIDF